MKVDPEGAKVRFIGVSAIPPRSDKAKELLETGEHKRTFLTTRLVSDVAHEFM